MCSYLDDKSLRILKITMALYEDVNKEVNRIGLKVDNSEIGGLTDEAKSLVITPSRGQLTNKIIRRRLNRTLQLDNVRCFEASAMHL